MWNGIDKRRFPRAQYPCIVNVRASGLAESIHTMTENIGIGGIRVIIKKGLGLFSWVELEIDLKDGNPNVICGGMIVWSIRKNEFQKDPVHFDTGIEFLDLKDIDRVRIESVVENALK